MKRQVVVIGLGRFGSYLAEVLFNMGHEVLALDKEERHVQAVSSHITHAIQADTTDEVILRKLGVGNFKIGIVAIGSDIQSNILSTLLLKKLGIRHVIARAENELHGSILEKIGADRVIYIEREKAARVAHEIILPDVVDYMPVSPGYGIARLGEALHFANKSLGDLGLGRKGRRGIAVLLIKRGKEVIIAPDSSEVIKANDVLIISGEDDAMEALLTEVKSLESRS
ncbi:MAG: TrkA family potassium uptake protein [Dehalococcoidia bacterium]|nr:TrkA family potassium uptake protein [Dehalococcoidia bacterium]